MQQVDCQLKSELSVIKNVDAGTVVSSSVVKALVVKVWQRELCTEAASATYAQPDSRSLLVIIVFIITHALASAFFAYGNLNTLGSKGLAEQSALANARKLFGGVDSKYVTEARRQNGSPAIVHNLTARYADWRGNVDKGKSQADEC